jgi:DNA-binding response OmpR family regulator
MAERPENGEHNAPLVFVVNDDTAFLELMEELLKDEGYRCRTLKSTKSAHDEIRESQPSLVVLDVRINNEEAGLLLLDLITIDPATSSIPVIVASANLQALAHREVELAAKGIYVLAKPFDIDELSALMTRAMRGSIATAASQSRQATENRGARSK